ncbi:KedN5 family methylcobalamin-dependent radical SAM C-methyltransferase [Solwaraspora sp. WMMA2056]|uniref:KedN5 family methylcobalamin-dependent radical SAM C-methyltransferase n=1 Tax=Solwaraspora sp. WMMA2056 TaxID=3015161 RepID=UPI00259BD361|nr:KedN5 family methylcobalamin-dependent radical SAM C-methyltransferase [Solwaraspora sp. WMMA2056]WJK42563.1 KedN5 family methylcobalamin-dependent radical SAM C-methyltransferase [Solwaraspora sp. WMMA2056]
MQQGVWEMPLESMPLAAGYLKASANADDEIRNGMDIEIRNFRGGVTNAHMANALFTEGVPDIIAFSVLGWNVNAFGALAATFKQLNPDGWVVFGGNHVTSQGNRVFRMFPEVDVVINGEGELTFRELLSAYLAGTSKHDLGAIPGLSYQSADRTVVTTEERDRIDDLEVIPSPFLTGALDLTDADGRFRYDVALMETNRGCPYKCSFCYWGGATGQKVRAFPMDRLRAELEVFGKLGVHTVVACDANFGMLPADYDFVEALIQTREKYGFPRALETSWAKNKSKTFYRIVRLMKEAGMKSSFTLALQTLNDSALVKMRRRNMKVNDWEDLTTWLAGEGLDCYAELIWGAPGETIESFMDGYDRLAEHMSRIAVYPMLLLPNTDYFEKKEQFGIKSVRGDHDDFEYILAHETMTFAENQHMQKFLFWARVIAENAVLRHIWAPLRRLAGLPQSKVLLNLEGWIAAADDPAADFLRGAQAKLGTDGLGEAIKFMFTDPDAERMLNRWWAESVRPLLSADRVALLDEVFWYDLLTRPVYRGDGAADGAELEIESVHGDDYYVRRAVAMRHDIPAIVAGLRAGQDPDLSARDCAVDLYYRVGSESAVTSTNHEIVVHYMGLPRHELAQGPTGRTFSGHGQG